MKNPNKKPVVRRSRNGCDECRRRRRRCDEKRPGCSQCLKTGCIYSVKLSWGGKTCDKSIFGKIIGPGRVGKIPSGKSGHDFVHGVTPPNTAFNTTTLTTSWETDFDGNQRKASEENDEVDYEGDNPENHEEDDKAETSKPPTDLDRTCQENCVSIKQRFYELHQYLTNETTCIIFCCDDNQNDYCSTLKPMSNNCPHLYSATLYLAACRRASIGLGQFDKETTCLYDFSLDHLQRSLALPESEINYEAAIASNLIFCLAAIICDHLESYRYHLRSARRLWAEMVEDPSFERRKVNSNIQFLKRWYNSFKNIAGRYGIEFETQFISQNNKPSLIESGLLHQGYYAAVQNSHSHSSATRLRLIYNNQDASAATSGGVDSEAYLRL